MADKLVGPKVKITLSKFLPTIFMDAMRENPEVSVHMFEGNEMRILENFKYIRLAGNILWFMCLDGLNKHAGKLQELGKARETRAEGE